MTDIDVLIIGGGIAGASLGAELAAHRRVMLVEAESQCGFHATGRSAAFWLENYGGPLVAPLSRASRAFLTRPPPEFAEEGFLTPRGVLHVGRAPEELPSLANGRAVARDELAGLIPGVRAEWTAAVFESSCSDIDVARLHAAYLRQLARAGGQVRTGSRLVAGEQRHGRWLVTLADGKQLSAAVLVNAAGAWADDVARRCGVKPLGIVPKRRTMVQLRVGRSGLKSMPLVIDAAESFYFKGEGDRTVWLSPHDEIPTEPCDAAPEEIDVAVAIDRFQRVVDWPIEAVERRWAGLRSFAPDRVPVYGFDPHAVGFFWCAGQGGFGIQTAPAAAGLAAALITGHDPDPAVEQIDPAGFSPARFPDPS